MPNPPDNPRARQPAQPKRRYARPAPGAPIELTVHRLRDTYSTTLPLRHSRRLPQLAGRCCATRSPGRCQEPRIPTSTYWSMSHTACSGTAFLLGIDRSTKRPRGKLPASYWTPRAGRSSDSRVGQVAVAGSPTNRSRAKRLLDRPPGRTGVTGLSQTVGEECGSPPGRSSRSRQISSNSVPGPPTNS